MIDGDFSKASLGLPQHTENFLVREQITDVFHVGAIAELEAPLTLLRRSNVNGTKYLLDMVLSAERSGLSIRVHHISTVAVAGNLRGTFRENQLSCGQEFHNAYEQSKYEAEHVVEEYRKKGLNITVYRPSIITGDSESGVTTKFQMFYQPLHFMAYDLFRELPMTENCTHSFVPVDYVAEAISLLGGVNHSLNRTWHLVNPHEVSLGRFVDTASRVLKFTKPSLIPMEHFSRKRLTPLQWKLIHPYIPYFNYHLRFAAQRTNSVLGSLGFRWPKMDESLLTRIFTYCLRSGFIPPKRDVANNISQS